MKAAHGLPVEFRVGRNSATSPTLKFLKDIFSLALAAIFRYLSKKKRKGRVNDCILYYISLFTFQALILGLVCMRMIMLMLHMLQDTEHKLLRTDC